MVSTAPGLFLASSAIRSSFVETVCELKVSPIVPAFGSNSGRPACDADGHAVERAERTVRAANAHVRVSRARIVDLEGTDPPAHVVTNPPYGERLAAGERLIRETEAALLRLPAGHRVSVLCSGKSPFRFPPGAERHVLYNGALRCELVSFDL